MILLVIDVFIKGPSSQSKNYKIHHQVDRQKRTDQVYTAPSNSHDLFLSSSSTCIKHAYKKSWWMVFWSWRREGFCLHGFWLRTIKLYTYTGPCLLPRAFVYMLMVASAHCFKFHYSIGGILVWSVSTISKKESIKISAIPADISSTRQTLNIDTG